MFNPAVAVAACDHVELPDGRIVGCRWARTFASRLKGLLGTSPGSLEGGVLCLSPCSSVHTFGMAYPIDVAFLDACGVVVSAARRVAAGRMLRAPRAVCVLERAAEPSAWFIPGDVVRLAP